METEKRCSKCGETQPLSEFVKDAQRKDGLYPQCRACGKQYREDHREELAIRAEEYRKNHREEAAAYNRKYQQDHREECTKRSADWRHANPVRAAAKCRRWRQAHPERAAGVTRRYRQANLNKHAAGEHRRRARKLGATVEAVDIEAVWAYWGPMCAYCGATEPLEIDHIASLSQGGPHSFDNLCVACRSCNSSKGAKKLIEWMWWKARVCEPTIMGVEQMGL